MGEDPLLTLLTALNLPGNLDPYLTRPAHFLAPNELTLSALVSSGYVAVDITHLASCSLYGAVLAEI